MNSRVRQEHGPGPPRLMFQVYWVKLTESVRTMGHTDALLDDRSCHLCDFSWTWRDTPAVLVRVREKSQEFESTLSYMV